MDERDLIGLQATGTGVTISNPINFIEDLSGNGTTPQTSTATHVYPVFRVWIDPAILAGLRKGQVIDDDRVTGLRTTVASVADGMVVFTEIGAIQSISSGFDLRTGSVVAVQAEHRTKAVTTSIYLQRTR